ncbi:ADP-ribose pyrophosphatase YjhB, NUDIX family [Marininema mesophilum]|uniref:ADP-ribose pyrophosphatase YjhB, NUDIX family n=1 Tax=Marininema mesophilum TaxID=1048340 RepID=A0A1H2SPZ7_9BACL|nr:NUDIX domain-containing protein [Marininema mesophilum]SDW33597.1 ADP-ribose pyrophosphatase YjhB, NUDIX family [Marininema mesophilum]
MKIRNSAKAILIHENKLLVIKHKDQDGIFYLLPGGGQIPGETLPETVKRELLEEAGVEVEVSKVILLRECFIDQDFHRVEFMFTCGLKRENSKYLKQDREQIGVEWLSIQELKSFPLYPVSLREAILNYYNGRSNLPIYAGEMP